MRVLFHFKNWNHLSAVSPDFLTFSTSVSHFSNKQKLLLFLQCSALLPYFSFYEGCNSGLFGANCSYPCLCASGTVCDPVDGCSACQATGFTGSRCDVDIDECAINPDICGPRGICTNSVGSYGCDCETWYHRVLDKCECKSINHSTNTLNL